MNRREFIGSSAVAVGAAGSLALEPEAEAAAVIREVYELRHYRLKPDAAPAGLLDYFGQALVPAAKRQGLGPVGVFVEQKPSAEPTVTLLLAFPAIAAFWAFGDKLAADKEYQRAGEAYIGAQPQSPAYARIESSLAAAFTGMPRLEAPDTAKPRQFELRTYESHSEAAHSRKVGMFNDGEIAIFRRCGLAPPYFLRSITR
ncbi:MAG: NIPSNAP family protein, partial [Armatimonadetes bacterium]|nr:NIPSNAP family protein [Armatimonadota bacterium]